MLRALFSKKCVLNSVDFCEEIYFFIPNNVFPKHTEQDFFFKIYTGLEKKKYCFVLYLACVFYCFK